MSSEPAAPAAVHPQTVPALLLRRATEQPDDEAVVGDAERWTFSTLLEQVRTCAAGLLAAGIRSGDRVGIWAPNSPRWVATSLAVQYLGASVVTVNTRYKAEEARDLLSRTDATALVTETGFLGLDYAGMLGAGSDEGTTSLPGLPALHTLIELGDAPTPGALGWTALMAGGTDHGAADAVADAVTAEAISVIMFTSGTTGRPKGAMLAQGQLLQLYGDYARNLGMQPGDRALAVNPFFHSFGFAAGILTCLLAGATIFPVATLDPADALDRIEREKITIVPGPPTLYAMLMDSPARPDRDTSSLRLAVTGASVVPAELVRRMRTDLGFSQIVTAYGLTETSGAVTMCGLDDPDEVVEATSGRPLPGVRVVIRDPKGRDLRTGEPGEICVQGTNVMTGYLDDPEATAQAIDSDGWLRTGDVGFLDDAGYLHITDRLKDVFIVGGFNAYPAEIEQVLAGHPGVSQVAVIGVPDERLGEVGKAYVIPRRDVPVEAAEVIAWCKQRMANYKVPREVIVTPTLPRNAAGKISKLDLRAWTPEADPS